MLITGLTGFVGRYLARHFPAPEYLVFGTSYPDYPLPSEKEVFFLDMRREEEVGEVVKEVKPDLVFHLAAVSNVGLSWGRRRETLETNLMGTFYLLEAVKRLVPASRVLVVSSSDVYGPRPGPEEGWLPLREETGYKIVDPYAFSKAGVELLSDFYARVEKMDIVIARPFPHTGPGQRPDFVCSDWARQIVQIEKEETEPVIRVGNLDCVRDFTDVRDTVRAYALLVQKGRRGEIYNVCSGSGIALRKILELLLSYSKTGIKVETDESRLRKVDIPVLIGNNLKLRAETGWTPLIPFEQTLRDLLDDWRSK